MEITITVYDTFEIPDGELQNCTATGVVETINKSVAARLASLASESWTAQAMPISISDRELVAQS